MRPLVFASMLFCVSCQADVGDVSAKPASSAGDAAYNVATRRVAGTDLAPITVAMLAAFAANIYVADGNGKPASCAGDDGLIPISNGWYRCDGECSDDPEVCCERPVEGAAEAGFAYQIWINQEHPDHRLLLLVFLGTQDRRDWCANFRRVGCGGDYHQYEQAALAIVDTASRAYDFWGGPDMYPLSVGHSLGGGLSELAGLTHDKVSPAVSFDASPIVGEDVARDQGLEGAVRGTTLRIYEKGEALQYLRWARRLADLIGPDEIVENVAVNLLSGNPIDQHSMGELACRLREVVQRHTPQGH